MRKIDISVLEGLKGLLLLFDFQIMVILASYNPYT